MVVACFKVFVHQTTSTDDTYEHRIAGIQIKELNLELYHYDERELHHSVHHLRETFCVTRYFQNGVRCKARI